MSFSTVDKTRYINSINWAGTTTMRTGTEEDMKDLSQFSTSDLFFNNDDQRIYIYVDENDKKRFIEVVTGNEKIIVPAMPAVPPTPQTDELFTEKEFELICNKEYK